MPYADRMPDIRCTNTRRMPSLRAMAQACCGHDKAHARDTRTPAHTPRARPSVHTSSHGSELQAQLQHAPTHTVGHTPGLLPLRSKRGRASRCHTPASGSAPGSVDTWPHSPRPRTRVPPGRHTHTHAAGNGTCPEPRTLSRGCPSSGHGLARARLRMRLCVQWHAQTCLIDGLGSKRRLHSTFPRRLQPHPINFLSHGLQRSTAAFHIQRLVLLR